jgi:two-component system, chemotaxis family, chemotaxis protein CheV
VSTLMKEVDARTRLAGANRLELLLFHLGEAETYGINVFKIRGVMRRPALTRMPETDARIEGLAHVRGQTMPVVNLRETLSLSGLGSSTSQGYVIMTEHNQSLHGFIVAGVDRIINISWDLIKQPPLMLQSHGGGTVTAVTVLDDARMVLILDVEKILADISPRSDEELYADILASASPRGKTVLFADDSLVARKQIIKTLTRLGLSYVQATTGREAWEYLNAAADKAAAEGRRVQDAIHLILTDIEMPEMDGFTLTKHVSSDQRFAGIPVIMHSSLTGTCIAAKGKAVGATDYITKFDPKVLADVIQRYC